MRIVYHTPLGKWSTCFASFNMYLPAHDVALPALRTVRVICQRPT